MVESLLDPIPGLGDTRRKALMKQFGSLKRLRAATAEEIEAVPGIGPATAESIVQALRDGSPAGPAIDTRTGEIIDDGEGST